MMMRRRRFLEGCGHGLAGLMGAAAGLLGIAQSGEAGREIAAEVAIVGGGLGGCAAALSALRAGRTVVLTEATDWIGWGPQTKRVRSWIFDSTGGFGEGAWKQDADGWVVKTSSVLRDGKKSTATFVLKRVDADTLSLQAKDRTVDGKSIPDTKELKLKRAR